MSPSVAIQPLLASPPAIPTAIINVVAHDDGIYVLEYLVGTGFWTIEMTWVPMLIHLATVSHCPRVLEFLQERYM